MAYIGRRECTTGVVDERCNVVLNNKIYWTRLLTALESLDVIASVDG